jgi:hypothetical protein
MLSRIYQASDVRLAPERRQRRITAPVRGVPVYVMLPLDTVSLLERNGTTQPLFIREKAMEVGLEMLSRAGVDGVMIDVWWGIAEHAGPGQYDFAAYRKLFEQVASKGLKVQAVMSFHAGQCTCSAAPAVGGDSMAGWVAAIGGDQSPLPALIPHVVRYLPSFSQCLKTPTVRVCVFPKRQLHTCQHLPPLPVPPAAAGNNVGDCCRISLPPWVLEAGEADPDIFFTDSSGYRNRECLSVGCGSHPVLHGRTPIQAHADFIAAFADEFGDMLGGVVSEVTVGMGPAGELRYPSYPEGDGRWRFPGIGQFQCYDK